MFFWFRQWNKCEKWSILDEVKAYDVNAYKQVCQFFGPPYIYAKAYNEHDDGVSRFLRFRLGTVQRRPHTVIYDDTEIILLTMKFCYRVNSGAVLSGVNTDITRQSLQWILLVSPRLSPHHKSYERSLRNHKLPVMRSLLIIEIIARIYRPMGRDSALSAAQRFDYIGLHTEYMGL